MLPAAAAIGLLALAVPGTSAHPEPVPIALQARHAPRGHATGVRRRALAAIGVPLDDFFLGTDLQWFGNISGASPRIACAPYPPFRPPRAARQSARRRSR